jgi:ribosome-associated translation inhibitor RaiA
MTTRPELLPIITKLQELIQTDPRKITLTVYRYETECVCQLKGEYTIPYVARHEDLVTALSMVTDKLPMPT